MPITLVPNGHTEVDASLGYRAVTTRRMSTRVEMLVIIRWVSDHHLGLFLM